MQSESPLVVQFAAQETPSAHLRLDGQLTVPVVAGQAPEVAPSHLRVVHWLPPLQLELHVTDEAEGWHCPAPLQPPATQVASFCAQVECGSWPLGTLVQRPSDEARLHCLQPLHDPTG